MNLFLRKTLASLRRALCRHKMLLFERNVYGDEVIQRSWNRSIWRCRDCAKVFDRAWLVKDGDPYLRERLYRDQ